MLPDNRCLLFLIWINLWLQQFYDVIISNLLKSCNVIEWECLCSSELNDGSFVGHYPKPSQVDRGPFNKNVCTL